MLKKNKIIRRDPTEFRLRFAAWKNGELVYENGLPKFATGTEGNIPEWLRKKLEGLTTERTDNTTVYRQEPAQPIRREYGKIVDPDLVERLLQRQPVVEKESTYKTKPRPQTFAGRVTQATGGDWIKADMASAGISQIPLIGTLNGAMDFGYDLNNSAHNTFDLEANTNTAMSGFALLPFLRNGLKMLKGKTFVDRLRNTYESIMTKYNTSNDVNKALKTARRSDAILDAHGLDWSNWSWGGPISKEHLDEYTLIEKLAKENGTFLKMPDGSIWDGDPHTWVLLMSKDGQKILPKRYFHGTDRRWTDNSGSDVSPEVLGLKSIWLNSNPHTSRTYTNSDDRVLEIGIPKETKMYSHDAQGRNWRTVIQDEDGNWLSTNDVASRPEYSDGMVEIKNVWDPGPVLTPKRSKYYINPQQDELNLTWELFSRIHHIGDDIVTNSSPRKSLKHNNGDFDLSNPNIYKALIPISIFGTGYGLYNTYAE